MRTALEPISRAEGEAHEGAGGRVMRPVRAANVEPEHDPAEALQAARKPVFLALGRTLHRVDPAAIGRLVTTGRYVELHAGKRCFRLRGSLRDVLQQLGGLPFIQVNRQEAVNLGRLQRVDRDLVVVDGVELSLSRSYRADLLHQLTILAGQ